MTSLRAPNNPDVTGCSRAEQGHRVGRVMKNNRPHFKSVYPVVRCIREPGQVRNKQMKRINEQLKTGKTQLKEAPLKNHPRNKDCSILTRIIKDLVLLMRSYLAQIRQSYLLQRAVLCGWKWSPGCRSWQHTGRCPRLACCALSGWCGWRTASRQEVCAASRLKPGS